MKRLLFDRRARERGATAAEYALVVSLVSLLVVVAPLALFDGFRSYCAGLVDTAGMLLGV